MAIERLNIEDKQGQREAEAKKAQVEEKAAYKKENEGRSKDYVITLDINNRNGNFRERAGFLRTLRDTIKEKVGNLIQKWRERGKILSIMPHEHTTRGRYEAALQKAEAKQKEAETKTEALANKAEKLQEQKDTIIELGDEWSNQHEDYEVAQAEAPKAIEHTIELGDEPNPYADMENRFSDVENDGETPPGFALPQNQEGGERENSNPNMLRFADAIRTVGPLKAGNEALALAVASGKLSAEQKALAKIALDSIKKIPNWGKEDKQAFEAVSKSLGLEKSAESKEASEKRETYTKLGQLIIDNGPLNLNNRELGQAFKNGNPSLEQLKNGFKAVAVIEHMAKWDKATINELNKAAKLIEKDLGIISMESKGNKAQGEQSSAAETAPAAKKVVSVEDFRRKAA